MQKLLLCVIIVLGLAPLPHSRALAQDATTQPTTRPRRQLALPPGFAIVEGSGLKAICEEGDRQWVIQTLQGFKPATRPATMPADLVERFAAQRQATVDQICKDLDVKDASAIHKRLNETIVAELARLHDFHPAVFHMVTTKTRLKELLKTQAWQDPAFYYNQIADDVYFRDSVALTTEGPMDDSVLAFIYNPTDDPAKRPERFANMLLASQRQIAEMISGRVMFTTQMAIAESMMKDVFGPLKLTTSQNWLATGIAGALSADYAAPIIGSPKNELLLMLVAEIRRNPIKTRTIDLLQPTDPSSLKTQYVMPYADAFRRKSVSVAIKILEKSREKLPALMASLREKPCATGDELVTRIKELTGVDVSRDVAPQ